MPEANKLLDNSYLVLLAEWKKQAKKGSAGMYVLLSDFAIRFSYHSGRIENRQITYHDTRDVFENGRASGYSGDVRTLFEIQNLKLCHDFMLENLAGSNPITEGLVFDFHKTLTQGTYDERRMEAGERPGKYKKGDYVVGVHGSGLPAFDVGVAVQELCEEVRDVPKRQVLTAAAYFHAKFENIHPFADGNGRCGRALTNYLLLLNGHPPIIVFDEDKLAYYGALNVFDAEGDLSALCTFLKAETVKTWPALIEDQ